MLKLQKSVRKAPTVKISVSENVAAAKVDVDDELLLLFLFSVDLNISPRII